MPIKPVDFQITVPRTVDVSKNQNDNINKAHAINKVQNTTLQNEAEMSLKQVQHRDKLYKTDNKEKHGKQGKNNSDQEGKDRHSGENNNEDNSTTIKEKKGKEIVHIDIRV